MSSDASPSIEECAPLKVDSDKDAPIAQLCDNEIRAESSDDDMPIMTRRQFREPGYERDHSLLKRERPPARESGRGHNDYATHNRPPPRHVSKQTPKKTGKSLKKQGQASLGAKPIKKADLAAKKAVIREIESYWGKSFIQAFIPKCHRPLVKRGQSGKRSACRSHENDPKKWLPSVLKAILMIAKLTNNKKWLRDAMNDVVRYRIKHTGNRKPQLVTTDFDVIEDMLVKQWDVAYAFEIRYKHLLVNRKDQEEADEDIDHILQAGEDEEDESEIDTDDDDDDDDDAETKQQERSEDEDDGVDDKNGGHGGVSGKYLLSSGYTKAPQQPPSAAPYQQSKHKKTQHRTRVKSEQFSPPPPRLKAQQPGPYGYGAQVPGYGPPVDPWGRSMTSYRGGPDTFAGYGGYAPYTGYFGYGPPPQYAGREDRHGSRHHPHPSSVYPPTHPMTPAPSMPESEQYGRGPSPFHRPKHSRYPYEQTPPRGRAPPDHQTQSRQPMIQDDARPKIKRESPGFDERIMSIEDFDDPMHDPGAQEEVTNDIDAEVEAAELELKLARLRAKQAALKKAK
jgi:hypothetical protein